MERDHNGSCSFTIDCLEATVAILEDRIERCTQFLLAPDLAYGLSPIGVIAALDILRGEDDDLGTPGFVA